MVSSRHRSAAMLAPNKPQLEEWTTREKLCLASLAIKHNNAWSTVARQMINFAEKNRPDGWTNQKTCAAQFDKLMNELGADKRPKRNEASDASSSVIYKKMAEKRINELEEKANQDRQTFLKVCRDLDALDVSDKTIKKETISTAERPATDKPTPQPTQLQTRQQHKSKTAAATSAKTSTSIPSKANTSISSEAEKPSTRALTRRESSRLNLEKTLAILYKEASEIKSLNQLSRPSAEIEKTLGSYDKVVLRHVDLTTIKKRLGGEVDDPHAVMNDLLLMFQNATMYYPTDHPTYKIAVEFREKLVPHWEQSLLDRSQRSRH